MCFLSPSFLPSSPYVFMAFSFYGSRKGRWRWDHGYQALSFVQSDIINIWKKKHLHLLANYAPNNSRNRFHTQADVPLVSIPEILNYSFQFIVNIKRRTHDIWGYFMSNYVFSRIKVDAKLKEWDKETGERVADKLCLSKRCLIFLAGNTTFI